MLQIFRYLISLKDPQLRCSRILFKYTVGCYNSLALRKFCKNKRYLTSAVNKYYECICKSGISRISDFETFKMVVSDPLNITTIYFSAEFSTNSLSLLNEYIKLKQLYPSIKFLLVDIDECPRAAYNYDITDIPSICVVRGVDIVNELITKKVNGDMLQIIQETKIIIEKELQNLKNYTWPSEYIRQILPQSTGSKSTYWHHNIGLDNSNIIDLGWLKP